MILLGALFAASVFVVDEGVDEAAVAAVVEGLEDAGEAVARIDAADKVALDGCDSDACAVEIAAAHGAELVVVVRRDGVTRIDVASGQVLPPLTTEPPPPTTTTTTTPPPPKGPPAPTRPPRDDRPVSSLGTALMAGGGVVASLGVVGVSAGVVALLQPGAAEQHTTGLALLGGGGLIAVSGLVVVGVGADLRE